MKRRTVLITLLLLLCGGMGWYAWRFHRIEPTHEGKGLSVWLQGYNSAYGGPEWRKTDEAVRRMGTNAVPFLLEWIGVCDHPLRRKLMRLARRQNFIKFQCAYAEVVETEEHQDQARNAFYALRPSANDIVPMLIGIYEQTNSYSFKGEASVILSVFGDLGPSAKDAVPLLLRETNSTNDWERIEAFWALRMILTDRESIVPVLRMVIADPESALPVFIKGLHDPNIRVREMAARGIGCFGIEGKSAVPALQELLEEENSILKAGPFSIEHNLALQATVAALAKINSDVNLGPDLNRRNF